MPYGDLVSVTRSTCFCCVCVSSELGQLSPGCGCSYSLVDDIVSELKARMKNRGDTGQIQRLEIALNQISSLESKIDKIMDHLRIPIPETMDADRGNNTKVIE